MSVKNEKPYSILLTKLKQYLLSIGIVNTLYIYYIDMKAPPIFIFQMGKVGSSSVRWSLVEQYPGPIIHSHDFYKVHTNKKVRWLWNRYYRRRKKIKIITLVREPVARNVSAFFQNFKQTVGIDIEYYNGSIDDLIKIFLDNYDHSIAINWMDNLKKYFDIDIYENFFPEEGYQLIENYLASVLVLKSEMSDSVKESAIKNFIGLDSFKLKRYNDSENKNYVMYYKDFKSKAVLPEDYFDYLHKSRYAQHFYSTQELEKARSKWRT